MDASQPVYHGMSSLRTPQILQSIQSSHRPTDTNIPSVPSFPPPYHPLQKKQALFQSIFHQTLPSHRPHLCSSPCHGLASSRRSSSLCGNRWQLCLSKPCHHRHFLHHRYLPPHRRSKRRYPTMGCISNRNYPHSLSHSYLCLCRQCHSIQPGSVCLRSGYILPCPHHYCKRNYSSLSSSRQCSSSFTTHSSYQYFSCVYSPFLSDMGVGLCR